MEQLNRYEKHYLHAQRVDETESNNFPLRARLFATARDSRSRATLTIGSRSPCRVAKSHGQEPEAQGGHAVTVGIRRERVPTSARTNDLCKCSICYPCLLSSFAPPFSPSSSSSSSLPFARRRFHRGRKGRETQSESVEENPERGKERERYTRKRYRGGCKRKEDTRKEEKKRAPAFQSPVSTRDPRPLNHPPQLGRNSVLFSPLLSAPFLLFSSLRARAFLPFLFYLYPPPLSLLSLFRPFLPDHGDNRPILRPLLLLSRLISSSSSANVPPARSDGRELWEKRRPARPTRYKGDGLR